MNNELIVETLEFMLKHNFFQFQSLLATKGDLHGCLLGPSLCVPTFGILGGGACIQISAVPQSQLALAEVHWWRPDDIGRKDAELALFLEELNCKDRNIHLTFSFHANTLPFMDLQVSLNKSRLETKTFRKETVASTLLQAGSHHLPSLIKGIPVGQFLRIRQNCSMVENFHVESKEMYGRFRERGYSHQCIQKNGQIHVIDWGPWIHHRYKMVDRLKRIQQSEWSLNLAPSGTK